MPWKECHIVEERLRFIARLLDGEKMAGLAPAVDCRDLSRPLSVLRDPDLAAGWQQTKSVLARCRCLPGIRDDQLAVRVSRWRRDP